MTVAELVFKLLQLDGTLPVVSYDTQRKEFVLVEEPQVVQAVDLCKMEEPTWWVEPDEGKAGTHFLVWLE